MTDLDCSNTNMYLKMTLLRAQQPTDQLVRKCQQKYLLQPLSNAAVTYRFVAVFLSPPLCCCVPLQCTGTPSISPYFLAAAVSAINLKYTQMHQQDLSHRGKKMW